uniref:Uncharacterized protein n=1 Tax=Cacopsylla melanoneura TaxID=428564 RepID=A0A8D9ETE5_9HEMI
MMTSLKSTLSSPVNKKTRDFYRKPLRSNSRKTKNSSRLRLSILFNLLKTITRKINDNLKLSKAQYSQIPTANAKLIPNDRRKICLQKIISRVFAQKFKIIL